MLASGWGREDRPVNACRQNGNHIFHNMHYATGRHLAADALDAGQQAEPFAFGTAGEADQPHVVLADLQLGMDRHLVAANAQRGKGLCRAVDEIADAGDVDHRPVRAGFIEHAGELGDHAPLNGTSVML